MNGPSPLVFDDLDALLASAGTDLGAAGPVPVDDGAVAGFLAATGDVSDRGTTAPPYLLLSLTNRLLPDLIQVPAAVSGVNYGAESVRFGEPVAIGAQVSVRARIVAAGECPGGVQTTIEIAVEADGCSEPACVVRSLSRWLR